MAVLQPCVIFFLLMLAGVYARRQGLLADAKRFYTRRNAQMFDVAAAAPAQQKG